MKLIGMLGGLGWEATSSYYRMLNEFTQRELGEGQAARVLLHSVNNGAVRQALGNGELDHVASLLCEAGHSLRSGGADFIIIASNAMHRFARQIEQVCGIDLLHICDPTSDEIRKASYRIVALLGTSSTMEGGFYTERLLGKSGARVITPGPEDRLEIDRIINDELSRGVLRSSARDFIAEVIRKLHDQGAEALVLGCSELTAIVTPDRDAIPIYDTTRLHTKAAVKRALEATGA